MPGMQLAALQLVACAAIYPYLTCISQPDVHAAASTGLPQIMSPQMSPLLRQPYMTSLAHPWLMHDCPPGAWAPVMGLLEFPLHQDV